MTVCPTRPAALPSALAAFDSATYLTVMPHPVPNLDLGQIIHPEGAVGEISVAQIPVFRQLKPQMIKPGQPC
jgi:hypothetical protein